jgi:hypothetical protein
MMVDNSSQDAGWYPDPLGRFDERWWDGSAWGIHVRRGTATLVDAPSAMTSADRENETPAEEDAPATAEPQRDPQGHVPPSRSKTRRRAVFITASLVVGAGLVTGALAIAGVFDTGASGPSQAQLAAAAKRRSEDAAVATATFAQSQLRAAIEAFNRTYTISLDQEKQAGARLDVGTARSAALQAADDLDTLYKSVNSIRFPRNTEQDVRALLASLSEEHTADANLGMPTSTFDAASVNAANQAHTSTVNTSNALDRDLTNIIESSGSSP